MWWQISEARASLFVRSEPLTQLGLSKDWRLYEGIVIRYPDGIIEPFLVAKNSWNISEPDIVQLQTQELARPEHYWLVYLPLSAIPRIVFYFKLSRNYCCSDSDILRPSLTAVCYSETNTDAVGSYIRIFDSSHFYPNIRSQLPVSGALQMKQLLIASFAQTISGSFEREREIADSPSSNGGYQRTPVIDRFAERPSRIEEYIVDAAIIAGLGIAAYFVAKDKS